MELLMDFACTISISWQDHLELGSTSCLEKKRSLKLGDFTISWLLQELGGGTSDNRIVDEQIENTDWEPKWVNKESSKASGK
jgi:hypothetical protein